MISLFRKSPAVEMSPEELKAELENLRSEILKISDCKFKVLIFRGQLFRLRESGADRREINDVLKKISRYEKDLQELEKLTARYAELNKKFHIMNGDPLPEPRPYSPPDMRPKREPRTINLKWRKTIMGVTTI
jgi:hypothetical protein